MTNTDMSQLPYPEDAIAALFFRGILKNPEEINEPQWNQFGRWKEPAKQLWEKRHSVDEVRKEWESISSILTELKTLVSGDLPVATAADRWFNQLRTLKNAYTPRPPAEYIVEGIFQAGSLNIVYGAPGSLKSMFVADACVSVVAGDPWLSGRKGSGITGYNTQKSPVLWLDFDNGRRRTDERFEALSRARNIAEDAPLYYLTLPSPWLDAGSKELIEEQAKLIVKLDAKMIVIDNLGLVSGTAQENSADMGHVMGHLRWLAEETGAAVVVIHHQRKSSGFGNTRAGDSLRGHSSIEASLDLALRVDRVDGESNVVVTATKVRGVDVPPIGARFTYLHKADTTELYEARFFGEVVETAVMKSKRIIREAIVTYIDDIKGKPNQDTLWRDVQAELGAAMEKAPGKNKILTELKGLVADGLVTTEPGRQGALLYTTTRKI